MISIIIPVYKAEQYISRCIDSILAQTFTDWELLLIDDGNPDRSGAICEFNTMVDSKTMIKNKVVIIVKSVVDDSIVGQKNFR